MKIIFDTSIIPLLIFILLGIIIKIISDYRNKKRQEIIDRFNKIFPPDDSLSYNDDEILK